MTTFAHCIEDENLCPGVVLMFPCKMKFLKRCQGQCSSPGLLRRVAFLILADVSEKYAVSIFVADERMGLSFFTYLCQVIKVVHIYMLTHYNTHNLYQCMCTLYYDSCHTWRFTFDYVLYGELPRQICHLTVRKSDRGQV